MAVSPCPAWCAAYARIVQTRASLESLERHYSATAARPRLRRPAVLDASCLSLTRSCREITQSFGLFLRFLGEGAPFNGRRDRSRRELRVDSGVRGTQHASRYGMPWGVKPVDNVPPSASHTADEWANPCDRG